MTAAQRAAWLRLRQAGVGSSDAPCILGLGYRTAADVYRDKVEPVSDEPPAGVLLRGIELEPVVSGMYTAATGEELMRPLDIVRHPQREWQLANLDRVRDDERVVELKTTAGFGAGWGAAGTDEVPDGYLAQCQHQMGVLGSDWCDLAALDVIAWEFRVYRIPFSQAFFEALTAREMVFWDHVQRREPLPPAWNDMPPVVVKGKSIDLGPNVAELIAQRRLLGDIEKEAKAEKERLTARIEAMLGDAEKATAGPWTVRRVNVKACRVEAYDKPATSYIRCDRTKGVA